MKKILCAIFGVAALTSGLVQAKDWENVRLAVDVPYQPFEYKAADGTLTGFEIELGNAVCAQAKVNCEWVIQSWDGIIPGLLARKYDAIFSSMSINEERKQKVAFSQPYYNTPTGFFVKDGSVINPANLESIKGKKIGVQRGTIQDDYATEHYGKIADIKRYTTGDELAQDLTDTQRLDMVVVDFPVGVETISIKPGFGAVGNTVQLGFGVGVAIRKRDKDLVELFNKALAEVKANGTYDTIMKKYFDYNIKL
jgi:arginine/ornithine transport system substrate-binding protein